jgi:membrane protease YdiL (CAAX protease family)
VPDRTPKAAGLFEAVLAFLLGSVLSGIGVALADSATGYKSGSSAPMPLVVTVFGLLGLWIGLVGGVVFYSRVWGSGNLRTDVGLDIRWPDLLIGAVAGIGTQLVLIPLLYLPFEHADRTLAHRLSGPAKMQTGAVHGAWQIAVLLLFVCVGAPIVEELFFRGLILRSLTRWLGPIVGIVGSAVLFGLAHFEALQLAGLILFGLVLAVLAYRTGRLGPGMAAHCAFNAVTVVSLTIIH